MGLVRILYFLALFFLIRAIYRKYFVIKKDDAVTGRKTAQDDIVDAEFTVIDDD